MGKIRSILDYLKNFRVQKKEYFLNARDEIMKANLLNLHRFSYVFLILEAVFLVVYLQDLTKSRMIFFMAGMIALELLMAVTISLYASRTVRRYEMVHLLCILQLLVIHALLVFLAIFPITSSVIVYYPLIYVLTPILFIIEVWENYILCALSSLSLIWLSIAFSDETIRDYNISAAAAAFVLILFISFFVMDFRLRHYQIQERLREMSSTDELTGIFNKSMTGYLGRAYYGSGVNRRIPKSALMVLDVDGFKAVNDTMGHAEGDRVLSAVGEKLHGLFREDDVVGRIGGDEFLILLKNTTDWNIIRYKAEQIRDALAGIHVTGSTKPVTCSIGVALSPNNGSTYEELFSKADRAMYQSKKKKPGQMKFYSAHPEEVTRPAILVADDAYASREIIKGIFSGEFDVLEAANGQEAMNQLHDYHEIIDVVILDLIMPGMDGYAVMEAMADDPKLRAIPVMVTTADPTMELKALKMGAVDLVIKPFNPGVLKQRVENLLHM